MVSVDGNELPSQNNTQTEKYHSGTSETPDTCKILNNTEDDIALNVRPAETTNITNDIQIPLFSWYLYQNYDEPALIKYCTLEFIKSHYGSRLKIFVLKEILLCTNVRICYIEEKKLTSYIYEDFRCEESSDFFKFYTIIDRDCKHPGSPFMIVLMPKYYNGVCQFNNLIDEQPNELTVHNTYFIINFTIYIKSISLFITDTHEHTLYLRLGNKTIYKSFFKQQFIVQHAGQIICLIHYKITDRYINFRPLYYPERPKQIPTYFNKAARNNEKYSTASNFMKQSKEVESTTDIHHDTKQYEFADVNENTTQDGPLSKESPSDVSRMNSGKCSHNEIM